MRFPTSALDANLAGRTNRLPRIVRTPWLPLLLLAAGLPASGLRAAEIRGTVLNQNTQRFLERARRSPAFSCNT